MHDSDIKVPMLKALSAWGAALITSFWQSWSTVPWDKCAQFAAFLYSLCLLWEYLSKKFKSPKDTENGTNQDLP